jgi:hypothetical protein
LILAVSPCWIGIGSALLLVFIRHRHGHFFGHQSAAGLLGILCTAAALHLALYQTRIEEKSKAEKD